MARCRKVCRLVLALLAGSTAARTQAPKQEPIANLTVGWTYLWADQGMNSRSNLNGWFARPAVALGRGYQAFADFTNYYGANKKGSINSHGFTFGLSKAVLTRPRVKPSVFAEAGDVRVSNAGTIVNQVSVNAGVNLTFPLTKWANLAVTPAEYIFLYPQGDWRNDFNSKVGLNFPIGRRHSDGSATSEERR